MDLKRGLATIVGSIAALGALAFLAPPPEATKPIPGRKIVKFWHMWSGEWQPVVEKICKRFNDYQTEYEVVPLYVPADGAVTKFMMSAAGGDTPDLVSQWNPVLGTWSDKHLIKPLEDVMTPAEKEKYKKEAFPIFLRHATYRGKIMCTIAGVDCAAVYYRLDDLKEVGRDQNSLPQSLEELVELGKQLDKRDSNGYIQRVGFLPKGLIQWAPVFGGRFKTQEGVAMDTPENRRTLNFIIDQVKRLGKDNVTRFISAQPADTGLTAPLLTGNYSMLLDGQWKVEQTAKVAPKGFEYCVAPLPPPKGCPPMASQTDPNYMMIPMAAKNPEGAWAFMKFWTGFDDAEAGGQNVTDMGWLPFCQRVADSKAYQAYLAKFPQYKTFVDLVKSPNLQGGPVGPTQSYVVDQIQKADDAAMQLTLTPNEALKRLDHDVKAELDHQRRLGNPGD